MAIIKQGILGGIQNKIGNIVGTSWKGIAVIKSLPVSVANPRTAPQVLQRDRFRFCIAFAVSILAEVIKPLWDRFAQRQSGYNAFVSSNINYFDDSGLISPSQLEISRGKMGATQIDTAIANGTSGNITITWLNDTGQGFKQATDTAYVVVRNRVSEKVFGYDTQVTRNELNLSISTDVRVGQLCDIWLAFRRIDGTIVSDTSYATALGED